MASVQKIYWDSACFLSFLQEETGKVERCTDALSRADRGEIVIVTSALSISEVLWTKNGPKLSSDKATLVRGFFKRSCFRVVDVTRRIAEASQTLVWDHDIRPKDAIHVATAIHLQIPVVETFDRGLISKTGMIGQPPLVIREPPEAGQAMLF